MSEEPILTSLRLYDELRLNATNVTRTEGTNVDIFTMPDGEEIALYHLAGILPFTTGDYKPSQGTFEDGATIALAANHLNIGDGSLVPEVRGLNERCKVRFTAEFKDTEYSPGVALSHVVDYTSRDPGSPERLPGAFIGAVRSAVSMPTSLVTGLLGYPQISAKSTSADLDDSSQFPLFARTIPSDHGSAVPIIIYLSKILKIKHLSVINVNDSYGNAYVQGMRLAANIYAPDMIFHQIPLDDGQSAIEAAVASLKSVGYNFVFAVVFTIPTHDALITEAYNQGVAGDGKHNWLFGDSFGSILSHRTFEKGSPLHSSYRGVGLLEVSGGLPEIVPAYDNFVSQMTDLRNHPKDMEYLGSLWPKHDHPDYGEDPPFIDSEVFLNGNLVNGFAPFMYEAVISLGLSACQASNDNLAFNGQDQFELLKQTRFEGISGTVSFDKTTGTRDPNSALYQVANFIEEETADGLVEFKPQTTDYFLNGNWSYIQDYIFNDGTSNLPPDLPPTEATDQINLGLAIGLPIAALVILGVLIHQLYASKRKENDSVWKVNREDLKFAVPPEIIGRGSFGVVLMAEYR